MDDFVNHSKRGGTATISKLNTAFNHYENFLREINHPLFKKFQDIPDNSDITEYLGKFTDYIYKKRAQQIIIDDEEAQQRIIDEDETIYDITAL